MATSAPTLLAPTVYQALVARIGHLEAHSPRQWGRMSADQMLCHCADQVRLALAQKPATETASWFNRIIAIRVALALPRLPLRNLPTPRDMRQGDAGRGTRPTTFAQDKALLLQTLVDFVTRPAAAPPAPHPAYGPLDRAQWGRFIYLHLDHHLRQFGG